MSGVAVAGAWLVPGSGALERARPTGGGVVRVPLPRLPIVSAAGRTLVAEEATVQLAGEAARVWAFDRQVPGVTLTANRGERVRIELRNALREPTIVHWHGLHVPEAADGHPRLAIPPGESYRYDFTIAQRAGTYWYHPHAHARTAAQVYRGLAGLLLVRDEEESALRLPDGDRELLLVLQDRRVGAEPRDAFVYRPAGPDMMVGHLGDTAFGNGVPWPTLEVEASTYRLRVLNASNARIFRLALGASESLLIIGNDGGLLPMPARASSVDIAPAERLDLLVDLAGQAPGSRLMLRSAEFALPGGMGPGMGGGGMGRGRGMGAMRGIAGAGASQGTPMELLELVVTRRGSPSHRVPTQLSALAPLAGGRIAAERRFRLSSHMMRHTINGREFDMSRVDERVPLGQLERWTFVNDDMLPHPVHVHATQFEVVGRTGGRGAVMPWERGRKDTVLVLPGESVDVLVRFDVHRGIFLLHCHNLEHEDAGMMMNFEVG